MVVLASVSRHFQAFSFFSFVRGAVARNFARSARSARNSAFVRAVGAQVPWGALRDLARCGSIAGVGLVVSDLPKVLPTFSKFWGLLSESPRIAHEMSVLPLSRPRVAREFPTGALGGVIRCGSSAGVGLVFSDEAEPFPGFPTSWGLMPKTSRVAREVREIPLFRADFVRESSVGALGAVARWGSSTGVGLVFSDESEPLPAFPTLWGLMPETSRIAHEVPEIPLSRAGFALESPVGALGPLCVVTPRVLSWLVGESCSDPPGPFPTSPALWALLRTSPLEMPKTLLFRAMSSASFPWSPTWVL